MVSGIGTTSSSPDNPLTRFSYIADNSLTQQGYFIDGKKEISSLKGLKL
jgi:hypothetical protein